MGHNEDVARNAVTAARRVAQRADFLRQMTETRAIQLLLADGLSQREVARLLQLSKSKVNRAAGAPLVYAVARDHDPALDDLVDTAAWGSPECAREIVKSIAEHK